MSNKNTKASLSKLTPAKLKSLYNKTLGDAAIDGTSKDDMITAILEFVPAETERVVPEVDAEVEGTVEEKPKDKKKKGGLQFGNKDKDKKYDLSGIKVPADHVVVRHFSSVVLANGSEMEDPTSNRFQVYDRETFDALNAQPTKGGKQQKSQFQELGLNVDVLHD